MNAEEQRQHEASGRWHRYAETAEDREVLGCGPYMLAWPEDRPFVTITREEFMAELGIVTPAWKLGEPFEGFDPYAIDGGDWPGLAFFPHVPVLVAPVDVGREGETGEWIVPMYLSLSDALLAEYGRRRERRLVADFEERQEQWAEYLREVFGRSIEVLQRIKREGGGGVHGL